MLSSECTRKNDRDRIRVDEAYCISHWYVHVSQASFYCYSILES